MRDVLRRCLRAAVAALLLLAAASAGGCSWPMWIARIASIEGVDVARIDAALAADPSGRMKLVRTAGDWRELVDDAGRTVDVSVREDTVRVSVSWLSFQPQPNLAEVTSRIDHVCAMLDAACPEIGEWEHDDKLGGPGLAILFVLAGVAAFPALITWIILQILRPTVRPRSGGPPLRAP